jgi:hypothetical protein
VKRAWLTVLLSACSSRSCSSPTASSFSDASSGMAAQLALVEAPGDPCEARVGPMRRAIVDAVDQRWAEIEAFGAQLGDAAPYRRERLGPTYVRVRTSEAPLPGWTTRERGWPALHATRASLPTAVDERWVALAREARAILVFDLQRRAAGAWKNRTHADLAPQSVAPNALVKREDGALLVPLDPGDFGPAKDALAAHVERPWRSVSLAVRVGWTQAAEPGAYRFVLGDVAGEPSHVVPERHEIVLNPDVRAGAIAHEIGHVLGFGERYAKRFDTDRCLYVDEIDPADVMSDPDGPVTAAEWTLLDRAYPAP